MSKIQTNIQKAIEKSRKRNSNVSAKNRDDPRSNSHNETITRNVFDALHTASPHDGVMEESLIAAATDDRAAKTAYSVLRTRVLQRVRSNNWQSILVTSPGPNEGKTLTATNLAMSLARDVNQTTVLVDLDLTRSSIAKYLGIEADIKAGVGDFLLGQADFSDVIYSPIGLERIAIVPNREPVDNSSDLMGSPQMRDLVRLLRDQSENAIVIYDMPPVLACDDVLAFCPNVDAILLVVAQGRTERTALDKSMAMLADHEMLGAVLNMSDEQVIDDGYNYY